MKKDEARFTVRFNPADPRHRIAMDMLVPAGRRKATLIADALCEYLARYGETSAPSYLPHGSQLPILIAEPTRSAHKGETAFAAEPVRRDVEATEITDDAMQTANSNEEMSFDDDMSQAIREGLSMFSLTGSP